MAIFRRAAFLIGICCISAFAHSQGNEVSLSLGGIKSYTQGNTPACNIAGFPVCPVPSSVFSLDTSFAFRAAFAHRLIGAGPASLDLELPLLAVPTRGVHIAGAISPGDLSSYYVTPSIKLRILGKAPIAPFLSVGGGLAHYNINSTSTNKGAVDLGGGADLRTPLPLLRLRLELRDVYSGQPNFGPGTVTDGTLRHNLFFGAGLALRF